MSASFGTTATCSWGTRPQAVSPTFLYNSVSHVLHFDPDGAGAQPLEGLAYIPSTELKQSNLVRLPLPYAGDRPFCRLVTGMGAARASGDFNGDGNYRCYLAEHTRSAERVVHP